MGSLIKDVEDLMIKQAGEEEPFAQSSVTQINHKVSFAQSRRRSEEFPRDVGAGA